MLSGKIVLVTGGGTGIGAAVARQVVQEGGIAIVTGRREAAVVEAAAAAGGSDVALGIAADAADPVDMARVVALAEARFGGVDAVVACAGTVEAGAVLDTPLDSWRRSMHSNLDTAFVTACLTLPQLIERRGSFLIISSIAGVGALPGCAGYMTAKHAVVGLMRSIAMDYGHVGVRANAVCPGWIRTPMGDESLAPIIERDGISVEEAYALVTSGAPLKRAGTVQEIADLCCFLVSDRARFITGSVVTADGGSTIPCVPTGAA